MKRKTVLLMSLLFVNLCLFAQTKSIVIKGKVLDENNQPLVGASVQLDSHKGTSTNSKGDFSITAPADSKISFSYVGYLSQSIQFSSNTEQTIVLKIDPVASAGNEVIVVGYGTTKKRDLTGSVIAVKPEEIRKVAAGNVMEALQGKLSGVDIVRTSGMAGATANVTIRGNRSIIAGNGPLYIVDGIQYTDYEDINPNDIQSLEVLKDASSTAIYGSRGANGVIIITTRKGALVKGKAKVNASTYYGAINVAGYPVPMNGPEFANLKRQAYRTNGVWASTADDPKIFTSAELAGIKNGTSTYWPGLLLKQGSQQDYSVGVAGGSDQTKIYFSFDYFKEQGVLLNDYSNRYSLRLNIEQSLSKSLKVGLQSQLTAYKTNSRADGVLTIANKIKPLYSPFDSLGNIIVLPGSDNQNNPLLDNDPTQYVNRTNITRIFSNGYAEWRPIAGLTLRSNLGIVNNSSELGYYEGANSINQLGTAGTVSSITDGRATNITWENIVTYQRKFGYHSIELTGVSSYLYNKTDSVSAEGKGQLLGSQYYYALQNNPTGIAVYSNYVSSTLISGTFRVNYAYKGKYLLTVTGRADGSSVLAPQNKWAFFPSVAAGWRISDEKFMKGHSVFNDLKLRASYGVAGNAAVKPYQTQSGLILVPYSWNNVNALAYGLNSQTGNPNLTWELTNTADVGVDFGILKNRIRGTIDYYQSNTHDLLILRQLPATTGVQTVLQNIGKTQNNGIEISIQTDNIKSANFSWSTSITFQSNHEQITDLPNGQNDIADNLFIGHPVSSFYDYQKTGIWQTADSTLAKSYGYKPGDIRVKDQNNSGKITADSDRVVLGSAVPKYSFGINNEFSYKSFDFGIYIYGRIGQMFNSQYADKFEPNAIENGINADYWTPENPTNSYPRPNSSISRAALPFATTLGYTDGSFVKIRSVTVGYTLPQDVLRKIHVSSLRFYISAKNYITFSKVKNYDPEGGGSFDQPLTKLITTGLNIDL